VREALARSSIRRILIIATSDRMINKITARLVLPDPLKTVYITDIATKQEIKKDTTVQIGDPAEVPYEMIQAIMFDIHRECVSVHYEIA